MRVLDVAVADAPAAIFGDTFWYATDEETALKLKPRVFACVLAHGVDPAPADAAALRVVVDRWPDALVDRGAKARRGSSHAPRCCAGPLRSSE